MKRTLLLSSASALRGTTRLVNHDRPLFAPRFRFLWLWMVAARRVYRTSAPYDGFRRREPARDERRCRQRSHDARNHARGRAHV